VTSRYRWVVLAVGALGAGAFSMLRMGLPSLGPALRDAFDLSLPQVGVVFSALAVGVVLTLLPWGALADRIGERIVLAAGLAGTAAALAIAAVAPGYHGLLGGLFLAGALGASTTGASGRAVMGWFPRTERGMALGVRQMALPLGGGLASLLLPAVALAHGVRAALWVLAAIALVAAAVVAVWMRDAPPPTPAQAAYARDVPPPLRDRRMWRLGAASALLVVGQSALLGFLVIFLHDEHGLPVAGAAAVLAALQLTGAAARVVVGRLSDRAGGRVPLLRRIAGADAVLLALLAPLAGGPTALVVPALLAAGVVAMCWNGLAFTAAAEIAGRARAGTAVSLQNTIVAVGAAAAPAGFGALVAATSWPAAFAACALAPVAAFVVLLPLVGDEERRAAERDARLARLAA
jgi:sugar phosphate permease